MGKNKSVFAIFSTRDALERAVDALKSAGFRNSDVSALFADKQGTHDFAHEKNTKVPEGASAGAGAGAIVGGTLGWLAGIGAIVIPGLGALIAAGPIVAALAGAGAGGALGGLTGGLIGLGIPEYEAKRYEGLVKKGGILLSVHADDAEWSRRAKQILLGCGASDVATASEEASESAPTHV